MAENDQLHAQLAEQKKQIESMQMQISGLGQRVDELTAENRDLRKRLEVATTQRAMTVVREGGARSPIHPTVANPTIASIDDVEVRLLGAAITKPRILTPLGDFITEKPYLCIKLEIVNHSDKKKANYTTWRRKDFSVKHDWASAEDDLGNIYKRMDFGLGSRPKYSVEGSTSIYPGKSVTDVLVFEPPVEKSGSIMVELPSINIGGEGSIEFQVTLDAD